MTTFQKRLTEAMFRAGKTQTALAKDLGITKGALNQWTSGATTPQPANMVACAKALGVDPYWLRTGEAPPTEAEPVAVSPAPTFQALWLKLLPEQQQEVQALMEAMIARNQQTLAELLKRYGEPVSDARVAQFLPSAPTKHNQ